MSGESSIALLRDLSMMGEDYAANTAHHTPAIAPAAGPAGCNADWRAAP